MFHDGSAEDNKQHAKLRQLDADILGYAFIFDWTVIDNQFNLNKSLFRSHLTWREHSRSARVLILFCSQNKKAVSIS